MASIANMPENWPLRGGDVNMSNVPFLTVPHSKLRQQSLHDPSPESSISPSSSTPDELFFSIEENSEATSPSYLTFEPVVSSVSENEPVDWRRYDSPQELLHTQLGTPNDISTLLESSIERIKARHVEEEERRVAAARKEMPLSRVRRVPLAPKRNISVATTSEQVLSNNQSRARGRSDVSLLSVDSGYNSRSPALGSPNSLRTPQEKRFLSSITAHFKHRRGEKLMSPLEKLGATSSILTLSDLNTTNTVEVSQPTPTTGECVSCLEDFSTSVLIKLSCHSYCSECFQRLVSTALESEVHWPVKCCLNTIHYSVIKPHLTTKAQKEYKEREAEWSIPAGDRVYCSTPNCSKWIAPKHINNQLYLATCTNCSKKSCTLCRAPSHNDSDCPQDPALVATINLAEAEGWKRCYSCHALVEHNKGCRHMTCRCKAQFCYICGERWRTCGCSDAQLGEIQEAVVMRRNEDAARTAIERALEEEERANIQLVAEFEAREAEREAAEALVREIEEDVRRRAEEEERQLREEARIVALHAKFHHLAEELEVLHAFQSILMAERYEHETETLKKDREGALAALSIRHSQESESLAQESKMKIAEAERIFAQEYHTRLTEERRVEDQYVEELREYWHSKPGGEYKVREGRDELRHDQEKEFKHWDSYRRRKMQALSEGEKRKREFLEMRMRSEIKEIEGRAKIDSVELERKNGAEQRWVGVVVEERIVMLGETERREYARIEL